MIAFNFSLFQEFNELGSTVLKAIKNFISDSLGFFTSVFLLLTVDFSVVGTFLQKGNTWVLLLCDICLVKQTNKQKVLFLSYLDHQVFPFTYPN